MSKTLKVYFAGELFDHKDLIGNALLASQIERISKGQYSIILPQNLEQATERAVDIRNQDLKEVIQCDLGLFNFDGTDLDSGTVVEFMLAKFLDIPSVIIRSDFRSSGDQAKDGDDWNLMCSFYPRTQLVQFNAMKLYQQAVRESDSLDEGMDRLYSKIASLLIGGLDSVRSLTPVYKGDKSELEGLYRWALKFPGSGLEDLCSDPSFVEQIVAAKLEKKMYP
jgi:nucleoside 2-deoxyribosyltransferase